jgi:hypothetical protein
MAAIQPNAILLTGDLVDAKTPGHKTVQDLREWQVMEDGSTPR